MLRLFIYIVLFFSLTKFSYSYLYIDGEFNGWNGETVVKLSDGTYWIQSEYFYYYCYAYNPKVELKRHYGTTKMLVKGCGNKEVAVEQLTTVMESTIDGEFYGFNKGTLFNLKNNTVWRQRQLKYWYKYANNPKCIIYIHSNKWKLSVLGNTVEVEPISGTINNYHYRIKYKTDNDYYDNYHYDFNDDFDDDFDNDFDFNYQILKTIIKIDNNTDKTLYCCYASYDNFNGWQSKGWYEVKPYSFITLDLGYYTGYVYLYAEYNLGELIWNDPDSPYTFCIHKTDAFTIPNADVIYCDDYNYKRVKMTEYYIKPGIFTWTLPPY